MAAGRPGDRSVMGRYGRVRAGEDTSGPAIAGASGICQHCDHDQRRGFPIMEIHKAVHGTLGWPLRRAVTLFGDREAIVDGEVRMTWRQWARRLDGMSGGLRRIGLAAGDVVAVIGLNSYRHLECWLGIPAAGLVVNDLNFRLAVAELEFILNDSGAKAIVVDRRFLDTGRELAKRCPALRQVIFADPGPAPEGTVHFDTIAEAEPLPADHPDLLSIHNDTLAAISYTGGTTGLPKGVMQSHGNLLANGRHLQFCNPYYSSDRYIHAPPMFHAADAMNAYILTYMGGCHVIMPGFDAAQFTEVVERERITVALLVPTMINMLVNHPDTAKRDLSSLRLMMYGASPMPVELLKRAIAALPCGFSQLYGMTEASPLVTASTVEDHQRGAAGEAPFAKRLASCGIPIMGVEAEVRRDDGTRCALGEAGEIWVRGPNVMLGYWNRPDETSKALPGGGWYRSGDVAYADADGYLYIVDRAKDMIISGGENVYTTEVENAIYRHPAVLEVAVFGIPDAQWGEAVHAEVVPKPGVAVTGEEIIAECKRHIGGYKLPRSVNVRTEPLPKSGAGKILKRDLRAPFWEGKARLVN